MPNRADMLRDLLMEFNSQCIALGKEYLGVTELEKGLIRYSFSDIEFITYCDKGGKTIGYKRNVCIDYAKGEFIANFDDDDTPSVNYVESLFKAIEEMPDLDCCSLRGTITTNGSNPQDFEHSIRYGEYKTVTGSHITYERYPNHLNLIRAEHVKRIRFPDLNRGEDSSFAHNLFYSGLLKKEYYIDHVIYFYKYFNYK